MTACRRHCGLCCVLAAACVLLTKHMLASTVDHSLVCPPGCECHGPMYSCVVQCNSRNLTRVPQPLGLSSLALELDLSNSELSHVEPDSFKGWTHLQTLKLQGNHIQQIPAYTFRGLKYLKSLFLGDNNISVLKVNAFAGLRNLEKLQLSGNEISELQANTFKDQHALKQLWLNANQLRVVPVSALNKLSQLGALTLAVNMLEEIPDYAFLNLTKLSVLLLHDNKISSIRDLAFKGLDSLHCLELDQNSLDTLPLALHDLNQLKELSIFKNKLQYLPKDSFSGNPNLEVLHLKGNPIHSMAPDVFRDLPNLQELKMSEVSEQEIFPDLTGTSGLMKLILDRARIKAIPPDLCDKVPNLMILDVHSNRISTIPAFSQCRELKTLNLGNNDLVSLEGQPFKGLTKLQDLTLADNYISNVPGDAFTDLTSLEYLDLEGNKIVHIDDEAFATLVNLEDLNLGENSFPHLPTKGLQNIRNLKTFNNRVLQDFPPPGTFKNIRLLTLSYAYHCCDYIQDEPEKPDMELKEDIKWLSVNRMDDDYLYNLTNVWGPLVNLSSDYRTFDQDVWEVFGTNYQVSLPSNIPQSAAEYYVNYDDQTPNAGDIVIARPPIRCKPLPGPFMPCNDLMEWWSLRCGVWIFFLLALLGNGVVFIVSVFSSTKMDVPRFLICNLACSDFFMGIYLGFLAVVDASTLGEFKKHAIAWQMSPGCLVAGFLAVLSSELSVFTLTVITLERYYAITHALQFNKRLSLKHASYIMAFGWVFAIIIASLPLFEISDYRKFAVCLPFEVGDVKSLSYICFIFLANGLAFLVIVICYTKMYCSIRSSHSWKSNDICIAKRMALLVFTDFACWAPITFCSLTAAFGLELISLNEAKVFTIFVLPLNSCANPFLYAIFTKQFKQHSSQLCKKIEAVNSYSHVSNKNISQSWGSSRNVSGLESYFGSKQEKKTHEMSVHMTEAGIPMLTFVSQSSDKKTKLQTQEGREFYLDLSRTNDRYYQFINQCQCHPTQYTASPKAGPVARFTFFGKKFKHFTAKKKKSGDVKWSARVLEWNVHEKDKGEDQCPNKEGSRFLFVPERKRKAETCGDTSQDCQMKESLVRSPSSKRGDFNSQCLNEFNLELRNGEVRSDPEGSESSDTGSAPQMSLPVTVDTPSPADIYSDNELTSDSLPSEYIPVGEESNSEKACLERFSAYDQPLATLRRCKADLRRANSIEVTTVPRRNKLRNLKATEFSSSLPLTGTNGSFLPSLDGPCSLRSTGLGEGHSS